MKWQGSGWFGAVSAVLTGTLFAVSLDVGPMGPLALVAPIPLLLYALCAPRAMPVALAAVAARAVGLVGVLYVYDDLPLPALLMFVVLFALIYAGVILLTRWIGRAAPAALAVFCYPLLLATVELLFGRVSPHGSFGAMGYSLVDVLPLLQMASLGGLAALTFCVALAPMAVAVALAHPQQWRSAAIAGALPLVLAAVFGAVRLTQPYESHARVALVGLDQFEARAFRGEAQAVETAQAFAEQVRKLAVAQPDFIVLPEKQLGGAREAAASSKLLRAAIGAQPVTLVAGFDEILIDGTRINSAQVFAPGQPLQRYLKRRLIPGAELGYATGPGPWVSGTHAVAICKDMDFPLMIRDYGQRGVQLMLVPAWDFVLDGRLHSRMAVVRGVENGFAMARAAAAGRLTASDRYGRVIAEAVTSDASAVTVTTKLGLRGGGTWYLRLGDAFGWVCVASVAALLLWRALKIRSGARTTAP